MSKFPTECPTFASALCATCNQRPTSALCIELYLEKYGSRLAFNFSIDASGMVVKIDERWGDFRKNVTAFPIHRVHPTAAKDHPGLFRSRPPRITCRVLAALRLLEWLPPSNVRWLLARF